MREAYDEVDAQTRHVDLSSQDKETFNNHHVQCMVEGYLWDICETNELTSLTMISYGGKSSFDHMATESNGLPAMDYKAWDRRDLEQISQISQRQSWYVQQSYRRSMPSVYAQLKYYGLVPSRSCPVPMDLHRADPEGGMFSTLVNFMPNQFIMGKRESQSARFQYYKNKIWDKTSTSKLLSAFGALSALHGPEGRHLNLTQISRLEEWGSPMCTSPVMDAWFEPRVNLLSTIMQVRHSLQAMFDPTNHANESEPTWMALLTDDIAMQFQAQQTATLTQTIACEERLASHTRSPLDVEKGQVQHENILHNHQEGGVPSAKLDNFLARGTGDDSDFGKYYSSEHEEDPNNDDETLNDPSVCCQYLQLPCQTCSSCKDGRLCNRKASTRVRRAIHYLVKLPADKPIYMQASPPFLPLFNLITRSYVINQSSRTVLVDWTQNLSLAAQRDMHESLMRILNQRDLEDFRRFSQHAGPLLYSEEPQVPTYETDGEDEEESSPPHKRQRSEGSQSSSSITNKGLSKLEQLFKHKDIGDEAPVYFSRQDYDHLKSCSVFLHICMTAMVAKLVRSATEACVTMELCGLMPMAIPRNLSSIQRLNVPHLCFACALFPKERCVKHAPIQKQRMVQVVQNQFMPPRDNVEALYLEHNRCLLYGGIVEDLENNVGRVRESMKQLTMLDEFEVEHRVQCAIQGLSWCIFEINALNSVTRIQYGGVATFENMRRPHNDVPQLDGTPWTYPTLQEHVGEALSSTVVQQEQVRRLMPEVYTMLAHPGLAFPRTCPVPMDLFRKEHRLGMFSTLVNFVPHNWASPETVSFRMQSYHNIVWNNGQIKRILAALGKGDTTILCPLYGVHEWDPRSFWPVWQTKVGERVNVISTIAQVAESIRDLVNRRRPCLKTRWLSILKKNLALAFNLHQTREQAPLQLHNGLLQGNGKPDKKKQKMGSDSKIKVSRVNQTEVKKRKQLVVLQLSYLDAEGWECVLSLLIRKGCGVRTMKKDGANTFQLYCEVNTDLTLWVDQLLQAVQTQIEDPQQSGSQICTKCAIRCQSEFFSGSLCTLCIFGYEIARAKASGSTVVCTDVRNKEHAYTMAEDNMPIIHIKKNANVSKQHFKLLAYFWKMINAYSEAESYTEVAKITARILNDAKFVKMESPPNDGLFNTTGTMCWAIAMLQMLAQCLEFVQMLQQVSTRNEDLIALRNLMFLLRGGVPPRATHQQVTKMANDCMTRLVNTVLIPESEHRQQDADEGLRCILQLLDDQGATNILNLFRGKIEISRKCTSCKTVETREEDFALPYIPLNGEVESIRDLVASNLTHRKQNSDAMCEVCNCRTKWEISETVLAFPKYCIAHMQRAIKSNKGERSTEKNNLQIKDVDKQFTITCRQGETNFTPLSWTQHIGKSANVGHFRTCTKKNSTDIFCYDDSTVTIMKMVDLNTADIAAILFETQVLGKLQLQTPSSSSTKPARDGTRDRKASTGGANAEERAAEAKAQETYANQTKARELEAATRQRAMMMQIKTSMQSPASTTSKDSTMCQHYSNGKSEAYHSTETLALAGSVRILNWNVRSIRNILTKMPKTPFEAETFDVLVLTETQTNLSRLTKHVRFEKAFAQFKYGFWNACLHEKQVGYCGVGVLCKVKPETVQWGFTTEEAECQTGRVVVLRWANVTLVAVYAPACLQDGTTEVKAFMKKLQVLVCLERARCFTFIAGDLNIPLTARDVSSEQPWLKGHAREYTEDRKVFQELLTTCELRDSCASNVGTFSWYPECTRKHQRLNVGMRVDYVLVPLSAQVVCCCVLTHLTASDHRAVLVEFNLTVEPEFNLRGVYGSCEVSMHNADGCDAQVAEVLRQTVENLYAMESRDFSTLKSIPKQLEGVHGLAQPMIHQVEMHPNPIEKVGEEECKREEDEMEAEFVQHSLKAYCKLRELRKLRDDLPPPRVKVFIMGTTTVHFGLVDTGATLCLCDAQLARKYILDYDSSLIRLKGFSMWLGDGETTMTVVGKLQITFGLEDKNGVRLEVTQWFYITKGLPDCVVLGDALFKDQRQHEADISQYHRHLTIKGHIVPYVDMKPHFHMYMSERETLPAGAKVKCFLTRLVKADGEKFSGLGTVCDRVDVTGVHVHPQEVFTWAKGGVWVYLINKAKKTITLTQGQSVACFQSTANPDEKMEVKTFTSSQRESTNSKLNTSPSGELGGEEAKAKILGSASVDSAGSNHSAVCGRASAASADSTACGYEFSEPILLQTATKVCTDEARVTHAHSIQEPILLQSTTRVTHAPNTSVDSVGSNHDTTYGHESVVGETHAACGYGRGQFYGYCHPACELVDVEGDRERVLAKGLKPSSGVHTVMCAENSQCLGEDSDYVLNEVKAMRAMHEYQIYRKLDGADSECVTLSTSQSEGRRKCNNFKKRMVPVQRLDLTNLNETQVSLGRHSQDVATDTTQKYGVSTGRAISLTGDLGVAAKSARDLFELDHLKYLETLMQNSLKIS
jgi:exodeoxyribonuclease III